MEDSAKGIAAMLILLTAFVIILFLTNFSTAFWTIGVGIIITIIVIVVSALNN
jgi:hypothetical protein